MPTLLAKQITKSDNSLLALNRPTQYRQNTFWKFGLSGEEIEKEHTTISGPDFRCFGYADTAFLQDIEEKYVNILSEPRSAMFLASKALYQVIFSTLILS